VAVFGAEPRAGPAAEAGRGAAQVHRYVEHRARDHADEFSLRLLDLIMEPAQHEAGGAAVIVLDKARIDPGGGEVPRVPRFIKEAAAIAEQLRLDQPDLGKGGGGDLHRPWPFSITLMRYWP
jgi:hypothetical protein